MSAACHPDCDEPFINDDVMDAVRAKHPVLDAILKSASYDGSQLQHEASMAFREIRRLRVGGVAERAVLDAAAAWYVADQQTMDVVVEPHERIQKGAAEARLSTAVYKLHGGRPEVEAAVRAWRGAAPTAEETQP